MRRCSASVEIVDLLSGAEKLMHSTSTTPLVVSIRNKGHYANCFIRLKTNDGKVSWIRRNRRQLENYAVIDGGKWTSK